MIDDNELPFRRLVKVERIPIPENMIMVDIDGRKMFFTERTYVETFETLAKLWEDLYYAKHRSGS